jgi:23S rRNA pseudouridine1911/1915/1917 synthase
MPLWKWRTTGESPLRADRSILEALTSNQGQWSEGEPVECSRSQLQRLMEEGHVTAQGAPVAANAKLKPDTEIEVRFPPPRPTRLVPEDRAIEILFEDEHLLVLNKPPGLTVHPSPTQLEGTLVHALLHHVKDLSGIGGELRPGIVHRIDKDTSGALVITKSDTAHRGLVEAFSKHAIEREYWALAYGSPAQRQGTIDTLIGRNPTDRTRMSAKVKTGRRAVTHFKRVEEYAQLGKRPFASWISVTLETGRTHQIRVHMTDLGHSLLGDPTYGTPGSNQPKWRALPAEIQERVEALPGQALHARVLGFVHPITGEKLRFESEAPDAFKALHEALGHFRGSSAIH